MIYFNVKDVINLLFSNSFKLTENYKSVKLAYENWDNNKIVCKVYKPHKVNLSVKTKTYNKKELKYLGKLANTMNYFLIKNNKKQYNLSEIDMYFIGDLMAARVFYQIFQRCKTINKYIQNGLVYNNKQYVYLPEFLSDHYNFTPKYTGVKQEIDTKSLIELSHRFNDNLFNAYYKFLTNFSLMDHRKSKT